MQLFLDTSKKNQTEQILLITSHPTGMYSTSLNQQVGSVVEKDSLLLSKDTIISDAVIAMRDKGVSSVLVTSVHSRSSHTKFSETEHTSLSWESAHSIEGIVTERDILYRVIAEKKIQRR